MAFSRYQGLVQQRADLVREGELLAAQDGEWTKEQAKRSAAITSQLMAIDAEMLPLIAERERLRHMPSSGGAPGAQTPSIADNFTDGPPARRGASGGRTFEALFGKPSPMAWESKEQFYNTLALGLAHPALVPMASVATTGVLSDGGFSVPEQLVAELLDAALEDEVVRPRATIVPMIGNSVKAWGFDASTSASTLYGAFAGGWVAEGAEFALEVPKLKQIELKANKLGILTEVSNELVGDGLGYASQLETALTAATSWFMDYGFLRGSGAGQPLGVLNDPALIAVAKEAGQGGATIFYENLSNMEARIHPACSNNAIYIASPSTRAQLLQLTRIVGVGGTAFSVLEGGPGAYTLLKRPVVFSEKMPTLGSQGDIILADLSQYLIGLRKDMSLDKSSHAGFTRDTSHFRAILRADGQGKWSSAYTPKSGATLSWCVAIAVRA